MVEVECNSEPYDEELVLVTNKLKNLLRSKHADYGSENLLRFGLFGIIVRMYDKLARLENLQNKKNKVNETIRDTLLDLAGYAIQAIILFFPEEAEND
jgi:hypothetical protein